MQSTPRQRVMIAGASGFIGQRLLRLLLADTRIAEVHAFVRRPLPDTLTASAPARLVQHVQDLGALDQLAPDFSADAAFNCLGTTIKVAGSQDAFRAVDQDAVLAFARLARRAGVRHFLSVSAIGASPRSGNFYSRVKGEVEQSLRAMDFETLTLLQPSLLTGEREEFRAGERVGQWLSAPISPLMIGPLAAYRPVSGDIVAGAMTGAAHDTRPGTRVLTRNDMLALLRR